MQHPTPATPDELAALFLRARDVPCPKCHYNRRDGLTAACPECGTDIIAAMDTLPFAAVLGIKRLRLIALFIACIAAVSGLRHAGEIWQLNNSVMYVAFGTPRTSPWPMFGSTMAMLYLGILGAFVSLYYAARILAESHRSSTPMIPQGYRINSAMLWLGVAILLPGFDHLFMLARLIIP